MQRFATNMEKYKDFSFFTGTGVAQKCLHGAPIGLNFNSWTDSKASRFADGSQANGNLLLEVHGRSVLRLI